MTDQTPRPIVPPVNEDTKWLAMTIRQGLLLIVKEIERRYQVGPDHKPTDRRAA